MDYIPLVSVVMSCYNSEKYLRESIESILTQTYSHFEFLIQNDSSSDKTEEIILSYNDERIKYILHERSFLSEALNNLCVMANGKYIARMDDDDISLPTRLEQEVMFLEDHNDFVLVGSPSIYIDDKGHKISRAFPYTNQKLIQRIPGLIWHPSVMFRKETFDKTPGYPSIKKKEDSVLWGQLAKYGKFKTFDTPLIKYRLLSSSLAHSDDITSPYNEMLHILVMKLRSDNQYSQIDIDLFNQICNLLPKSKESATSMQNSTREEIVFNGLRSILGEKIASDVIIKFRNIYGLYKFRNQL